jgi:DNA-binding transcriptional ArsR family regulator
MIVDMKVLKPGGNQMNCEFDEYSNPELIEAIDKWIHGKTNREIMKLKIIDHETIESIAEKVDLSPITVQRKYKRLKRLLLCRLCVVK